MKVDSPTTPRCCHVGSLGDWDGRCSDGPGGGESGGAGVTFALGELDTAGEGVEVTEGVGD